MASQADILAEINRPRLVAREGMNDWCAFEDCREPQWDTLPMCEGHAMDVWCEVGLFRMPALGGGKAISQMYQAHARAEAWHDGRREIVTGNMPKWTPRNDPRESKAGHVYYLKVGDQVKIGFSADVATRLRSYPPASVLLATHPGTFGVERSMHLKFADDLENGNEWFAMSQAIIDHIKYVRDNFKQHKLVVTA